MQTNRRKKSLKTAVIIALAGLTFLLLGPFLIPVPSLVNTLPPQELAEPDSQFVNINEILVHYKSTGTGNPNLILLHGFGASIFSWRSVINPLAEYGTVIAYDRPAFGLTERPMEWEGETSPYSPSSQVDLVIALMNELGIEQAILIGNSAGGTVALNTALAYPERIQALVLVDAAVYQGGGAPKFIRPLLDTPQLDHLGPLFARQISKRGDQFITSAWSNPSLITDSVFEGYRKPLRAENWDRALWELTKASRESNLEDYLQNITVPALVISGEDDQIVPVDLSVQLAEDLPDARLAIFQNCGHLPQEECPEEFLEAVVNFLEEF